MKKSPNRPRHAVTLTLLTVMSVSIAGCSKGSDGGESDTPKDVQMVVDTGPGGGSDVFARQVAKIALANRLIPTNWPVVNQPEGGGLGAMSFLKQRSGQSNYIAAFTSKWIISGLDTPNAEATVSDLTPIAQVAVEPQMVAVSAKSPYKTFADFIAAAKQRPGQLVQVGGGYSSVDNLAALKIEQNTGTSWKYLSFSDGGPRITALLRGDAQMMVGAQTDFAEEVAAGQLRIIGVLGDQRVPTYPNVPTLTEEGVSQAGLPQVLQWRAIAGPPHMSAAAVSYYRGVFSRLSRTADWKKYMDEEGLIPSYVTGPTFENSIKNFSASMAPMISLIKKGAK